MPSPDGRSRRRDRERERAPRRVSWQAFSYACLIVYGSLYPFSGWSPPSGGLFEFLVPAPRFHQSLADLLTNLLAYMPLGLLLAHRARRLQLRGNPIVRATLVGAALSCAVEFVQIFLPSRVSSGIDLLANTLGTMIGAVLARYTGRDAPTREMLVRWRDRWFVQGTTADLGLFAVAAWTLSRLMPVVPSLDVGKLRTALAPLARVVADPHAFSGWQFLGDAMIFAGMGSIACSLVRPGRPALVAYLVLTCIIVTGQIPIMTRQLSAEMLLGSVAGLAATALICRGPLQIRGSVAFFLCFSSFCITESVTSQTGELAHSFNWIPFGAKLDDTLGGIASLLELVGLSTALAWSVRAASTQRAILWPPWIAGILVGIGTFALEFNQDKVPGRMGDITTPLVVVATWIIAMRFTTADDTVPTEAGSEAVEQDRVGTRQGTPRAAALGMRVRYAALGWAVLAGAIWAGGRLPVVPYNVRELLYQGHPIRSAVLLALALALTLAAPAWLITWVARRPWTWLLAPVALVVNAFATWWIVVNAVAGESIHDIVGSPILGWPGSTETCLRFVALHATITFLVAWAVVLAMLAYRLASVALLARWILLTIPLAWISHWVIVKQAATDNLTELMRGGGTITTSALLSLAAILGFLAGSLIAAGIALGRKRSVAVALAVGASIGAFFLANAALEPAVTKYGKVFSALQFLLSPDRTRYVGQGELLLRYGLAQAILVGTIVMLQLPAWLTVAGRSSSPITGNDRTRSGFAQRS